MVTSDQAEELAKKHVQDYLDSCGCRSVEDAGNVLLKLLSVTAVSIAATKGKDVAMDMLVGTMGFISKQKGTWTHASIH